MLHILRSPVTYVYPGLELVKRYTSVVTEYLPTNIFADCGRSVQLEEHVRLENVLRALHLFLGDGYTQPYPFTLDVIQEVLARHRIAHVVYAPKTCVL